MDADEKHRFILIVGTGITLMLLVVVAVFALDVRSIVQANKPQVEAAVDDVVANVLPLNNPMIDEYGNSILEDEFKLPQGIDMRGPVERGQTVSGSVEMNRLEGWILEGHKGDQFLLDFEPLEGGYYWQMTVYEEDRDMLAFTADSESGYADFTQLPVRLPADGVYYVVISGFGENGDYALAVH